MTVWKGSKHQCAYSAGTKTSRMSLPIHDVLKLLGEKFLCHLWGKFGKNGVLDPNFV
jgi:hypothetical protein